jgi:hypothetical protein
MRRVELRHPRVVIDAAPDHDGRRRHLPGRFRVDGEKVGILVGIGQDARDADLVAADLLGHPAIKILRRHDGNGRTVRNNGGKQNDKEGKEAHASDIYANAMHLQ